LFKNGVIPMVLSISFTHPMPCGNEGMSGPFNFTLVTGPGSLIFLYIPKATTTNPHSDIHHPKTKPGVQSPFNPGSPRFASITTLTLNTTIDINCTKEIRSDNRKSKNKQTKHENIPGRPMHGFTLKQFISVPSNPLRRCNSQTASKNASSSTADHTQS